MRELPDDKQREVADFAEFLAFRAAQGQPRRSPRGLCADLEVVITEADLAETRRELWGSLAEREI